MSCGMLDLLSKLVSVCVRVCVCVCVRVCARAQVYVRPACGRLSCTQVVGVVMDYLYNAACDKDHSLHNTRWECSGMIGI